MPFTNPNREPVKIEGEVNLNFESLIKLLDDKDVKLTNDLDPLEADVGKLFYFVRTFSGNKVLENSDGDKLSSLFECVPPENMDVMTTLNDFALYSGKQLMCSLFDDADSVMQQIALNSFPIPFGIYYDPESKCNVVIMQMCIKDDALPEMKGQFKLVPVKESELPEHIVKHFKYTQE